MSTTTTHFKWALAKKYDYEERGISALLEDGWEPFTVSRSDPLQYDTIWFRRQEVTGVEITP